jgi:hypothetical protein
VDGDDGDGDGDGDGGKDREQERDELLTIFCNIYVANPIRTL